MEDSVLAIPNFTLLADARKGRRPAFVGAAPPEAARPVFEAFLAALRAAGLAVQEGIFGARMRIRSEADGPVNILLDISPPESLPSPGDSPQNPPPMSSPPQNGPPQNEAGPGPLRP